VSDQPIWDLDADRRLLDPGPGDLDTTYDVLVVGGGVVGLATAALCRRAGLGRVAVVERRRLAGGPSGRGGGILAPALHYGTDPASLVALGLSSLALWKQLDREWDGAIEVQPLDILQTLPPPEAHARPPAGEAPSPAGASAGGEGTALAAEPQVAPGWGGELLDPEEARAVEPQVAPGCAAVLLRGQARVHPLRLAVALARRAGTVATRVQVTAVEAAGSGGVRVRTDRGDLHAGAVVLATGSAPAIRGLPPVAGQRLVKGVLITTAPAPFRLRFPIGGRGGLAGQLPDGRLLFGNTFDPTDGSPDIRPEALAATRGDLEALIPASAGLPLSHAWSCFRPATAAGLPVIDGVAGLDHIWTSYGHFHTGFLLAAATGQALATWISNGERPGEVAAFSARQGPEPEAPART
jgi:glycine/D-amino acid oxidase-like deaminating enzyme